MAAARARKVGRSRQIPLSGNDAVKRSGKESLRLEQLRSHGSAWSAWLTRGVFLLALCSLAWWLYTRGDPAETPIAEVAPARGFTTTEPIPPPIPVAEDPRGCKIEPKVTVHQAPMPKLPRSAWKPKTFPPPYAGGDYRSMFHTNEEKAK